ncbi:MAG TPA: hypothetical protein DIV39_12580 [Verrucomicrobiales bacterium]|nr:hypothetical protein [Verrucomicrobiales bacterium]|tara:strand:- start:2231 stop:2620 length:390 start_codon:yes stop_codon:yes gene_type:complete
MRSRTKTTDPASLFEKCRRSKRRWLVIQWSFVVLLTASIMVGLGSTVDRLKQTILMADNQSISESSYEEMIDRTLLAGKLGLAIGIVAFSGYLFAAIMHHRSKLNLQQVHDQSVLPDRPEPPAEREDVT